MTEPLKAISEGTLTIGGVDLVVVVLEGGHRVIEEKSLERFFDAMARAESAEQRADHLAEVMVPLQEFFDYHAPRKGYQCEFSGEQLLVDAVRAILAGKGE